MVLYSQSVVPWLGQTQQLYSPKEGAMFGRIIVVLVVLLQGLMQLGCASPTTPTGGLTVDHQASEPVVDPSNGPYQVQTMTVLPASGSAVMTMGTTWSISQKAWCSPELHIVGPAFVDVEGHYQTQYNGARECTGGRYYTGFTTSGVITQRNLDFARGRPIKLVLVSAADSTAWDKSAVSLVLPLAEWQ